MQVKWGYLRETTENALKDGKDKFTGILRTGLNEYLSVIYPNINDWIHNERTGLIKEGRTALLRPDYRSESLKLIVEYDGLPHYTSPDVIIRDYENTKFYVSQGYRVVRIPFFIQLTNKAVLKLFGVNVQEELFPENVTCLHPIEHNTPAYLCPMGIRRMAREFYEFPEQYEINRVLLYCLNDEVHTEITYLMNEYNIHSNFMSQNPN